MTVKYWSPIRDFPSLLKQSVCWWCWFVNDGDGDEKCMFIIENPVFGIIMIIIL